MGILSFCLGIGSLESSVASLLPFVAGSHDISSFLDGKPCLTTCGVRSHGCYGNEKSLLLVHLSFPLHQTDCFKFIAFLISLFFFLSFFFFFFSFFSLFWQLLTVLCWRSTTKDELRLALSLPSRVTISTIWFILVVYTSVVLDLSLLGTFWRKLPRKRRVGF